MESVPSLSIAETDELNYKDFETSEHKKEDRLGKGGFGDVYRCYYKANTDAEKIVAIKFVYVGSGPQGKKKRHDREEVMHELRMLKLAASSHIVKAYGYIERRNWLGLVLEYAERGSLYDVHSNINLPWPLRVRIMHEVAAGMAHLHSLNDYERMTHNDLKPQNILIDRDFHAKIGDLGASNIDMHSDRASFNRHDGTYRVCSALYTAPEFFLRDSRLTRRKAMDVYSYAMVIYFVLTVDEPFQECTYASEFEAKLKRGEHPMLDMENLTGHWKSGDDISDFNKLESIMVKGWIYDACGPARAKSDDKSGIKEVNYSSMDSTPIVLTSIGTSGSRTISSNVGMLPEYDHRSDLSSPHRKQSKRCEEMKIGSQELGTEGEISTGRKMQETSGSGGEDNNAVPYVSKSEVASTKVQPFPAQDKDGLSIDAEPAAVASLCDGPSVAYKPPATSRITRKRNIRSWLENAQFDNDDGGWRSADEPVFSGQAEKRPTMKEIEKELCDYLRGKAGLVEAAVKVAKADHPYQRRIPRRLVSFERRCQQLEGSIHAKP